MSEIKKTFWLDPQQVALVVIDIQEKLTPAINQDLYQQVLLNTPLLIEGFKALGIPIIATEQYPKGIGHTAKEYQGATEQFCIEKMSFSCCGSEEFNETLKKTGVRQVLVTGMETHVCVLQTVLDLLDRGFVVHLVRDALASRFVSDYNNALDLAAQAGAVITTTETALFQLVKVAGTSEFKAISRLVKQRTP